ncbi:uncharacterized protein LOC122077181 isoform X2 [Macadamia integrifolia]|uniref:uncharacterized protein LOC122077181 isoform X2 n=1 Tax=Macadamia integrifolia TaxID=60698 RepID=UPI001C4FD48A|nr:uncharacterized protein LOC122077181 isoform X2 [Macadamia integrifolia]
MASSSSVAKPGGTDESNRKLGELLQEQQEPFLLDVYLLERGYPSSTRRKGRKHHYSVTATSGCYPCSCPRNISDRNLKTFPTTTSGYGLKLNTPIRVVRNLSIPRNIHPRVPTTLRNINKLLSVSTSHRKTTKSHHFRACHDDGRVGIDAVAPSELEETIHHSQAAELGRVSSYITTTTTTTTTVFDSCSDRDKHHQEEVSASVSVSPSSNQQDHVRSSSAHHSQASKFWNLNQQEIATDKEYQWGCIEDCNKQLSPVSVLEEVSVPPPVSSLYIHHGLRPRGRRTITTFTRREEDQEEKKAASTPIPNQLNNFRVTEDSILSASLWELLLQRSLAQKRGSGGTEAVLREFLGSEGLDSSSHSHSQYVKTKRLLQQTRQLLFDCVREAVEKYRTGSGRRRRRRCHGGLNRFVGPEELGRIICEEILVWGKQSVDIANVNQLIEADVSETMEEEGWSGFLNPHSHSIGNEIGLGIADAIMGEMSNEIVSDMIHISAFNTHKSKLKTSSSCSC